MSLVLIYLRYLVFIYSLQEFYVLGLVLSTLLVFLVPVFGFLMLMVLLEKLLLVLHLGGQKALIHLIQVELQHIILLPELWVF